jgi:citronellol/citronellal dehydrogenase
MSPPLDMKMLKGRVAYCISKFGMTLLAKGVAEEMRDFNIQANALWPATAVESQATINLQLGDPVPCLVFAFARALSHAFVSSCIVS